MCIAAGAKVGRSGLASWGVLGLVITQNKADRGKNSMSTSGLHMCMLSHCMHAHMHKPTIKHEHTCRHVQYIYVYTHTHTSVFPSSSEVSLQQLLVKPRV